MDKSVGDLLNNLDEIRHTRRYNHGIWGKGNGTFPQNDFMPTILEYAKVNYNFNNTYPG